jgi:hypothetical protein
LQNNVVKSANPTEARDAHQIDRRRRVVREHVHVPHDLAVQVDPFEKANFETKKSDFRFKG